MRIFSRKPTTRSDLVAAADAARARGRLRKAVAGYREALESDPGDPSVNAKLAPLLANLGDPAGAVACFRLAAARLLEQGFLDRAAAVTATAAGAFPLDPGFRLELARLNVLRGRRPDAVATLLAGGAALVRARRAAEAAPLLERALELEPWQLEAGLALVPIRARSGRDGEARALVDGLLLRYGGGAVRRIRWAAFRTWPGPATFWGWLRARPAPAARPRPGG